MFIHTYVSLLLVSIVYFLLGFFSSDGLELVTECLVLTVKTKTKTFHLVTIETYYNSTLKSP